MAARRPFWIFFAKKFHPGLTFNSPVLSFSDNTKLCPLCSCNAGEDAQHFLLHCSHFQTLRTTFNDKISKIVKTYTHWSDRSKLKLLLDVQCGNHVRIPDTKIPNFNSLVLSHIKTMYDARTKCS